MERQANIAPERNSSDEEEKEKKDAVPSTSTVTAATGSSGTESEDVTMDMIRRFFTQTLGFGGSSSAKGENGVPVDKVIPDLTFEGLTSHWREHGFKKIVTMVGAGISTSAGIPDFRSPGSGLYNNLKKYKLPHPTAIFDLDYFEKNPKPFFALAKELYPGSFVPTLAHYFVRLLHDKGLLLRHYTQNIDTLDRLTGLPEQKIIEAHGSFYTNHCTKCRKAYDMAWMKEQIFSDQLPTCEQCQGVVKPDIVFFGESLPADFYTCPETDFKDCDLLIIMGTSLEVHPFASLVQRAGPRCVRLLINRDSVGQASLVPWMGPDDCSLLYNKPNNTRDVAYLGDCDSGVEELSKALGWYDELHQLVNEERKRLKLEEEKQSHVKKPAQGKQEKKTSK
ncbi:NAD-dependent protein deacetylase Sirt2 [Scaptodrosophila lebanonensis]|uniref:NAD-dependent protein deacetylase n=1 Tax=Drosophila lebanonensis TaxID=7225 RepID=A0A6J2T2M0_DROLE|nr:NAD-dependent protein deacetylase Sirt2 [Scaptodrosophila lebanonensis]